VDGGTQQEDMEHRNFATKVKISLKEPTDKKRNERKFQE
jgi:hypothetical protein